MDSTLMNESIQVDEIEQVRVSLFNLDPPDSLRLTADTSTVKIFTNEHEVHFTDISIDLAVTIKNGTLFLETAGIHQPIDSLLIHAGSSSTRVITEKYGYRFYSGRLLVKPNAAGERIAVINHVDLEDYIASVVGSEMNFEEPEALKAQAVVSRTYALWSIAKSPYSGFDVRDYESNQMYVGEIRNRPHYNEAAEDTRGEILTWSDQLILAVFSSTCGGTTANNEDVWDGESHPYLRSQQDGGMCSASPHYSWTHIMKREDLQSIIRNMYGFRFEQVRLEKDISGRIANLLLLDPSGDTLRFTGNEFRLLLNKSFGPLSVRSTRFEWEEDESQITLKGNGLGHGVGMCQWGARGFAETGWNYNDILSFYFSGTKIVNLDDIESNQLTLYP